MNRLFLGLVLILFSFQLSQNTLARDNIRELFKNNKAVIYTINIRSFGAVDKNNDGILEGADIKGNFTNAKERLKELKQEGINVVYVLPITPTGKIKALGTLGSLYAMNSFNEIDPRLDDYENDLDVFEEARAFVDEAHKLDMNVILDLPSCGAYDMALRKPDLFLTDEKGEFIVPSDWTDIRLFKNDENVLNCFKSFIDMAQKLGFDGIRADVAAIKPYEFWKELITYARKNNENFFFLAEASPHWSSPSDVITNYTSINELLDAGFDSYYGSFSDFKNLKTKKEFDEKIEANLKILNKYKDKSIISALATHDQQAPILRSVNYWNMVLWLCVTLPSNTYFLDGFSTGDDFCYKYENQKARITRTDDEYYFVHSGMFDIFNYSPRPQGKYPKLKRQYIKAIGFKQRFSDLINEGKFKLIETDNENVFGYSIEDKDRELIVIGSLDDTKIQKAKVKSKLLKKEYLFTLFSAKAHPDVRQDCINAILEPLEIQVYLISLARTRAM